MNYLKSHFSTVLFFALPTLFLVSCEDDSLLPPTAFCADGIMNGTETGIDCGGNCTPCAGTPTCTDGIMNGDETGVDCGGSCTPCAAPTCTDGIMNGDETGVDCGGSSAPCAVTPSCTDGIMNGDETGIDCGGSCPNACNPTGEYMTGDIIGTGDPSATPFAANLVLGFDDGTTLEFQSDQSQERQLFFIVPPGVATGTYDLVNTSGFSAEYKEFGEGTYTTESGSIVITSHDTGTQWLYGTFEFMAVQYDFGTPIDTIVVSSGAFGVEYAN